MRQFRKENNRTFFQGEEGHVFMEKWNMPNKKIEKKHGYGKYYKFHTKKHFQERYFSANNYYYKGKEEEEGEGEGGMTGGVSRSGDYIQEFPTKWKRGKKRNYKFAATYAEANKRSQNSPHHLVVTSIISRNVNIDEYAIELEKVYFPENKNVDNILQRIENEIRNATFLLINTSRKNIFTREYMRNFCKHQFLSNALLNLFNDLGKETIKLHAILKPSLTEINMRKTVIQKIKNVCRCAYNKYHFIVFGSCSTDLDIYNSDLDVCIYTDRNALDKREVGYFYGKLRSSEDFKDAHIKMICGAHVPIIKCVFYYTGFSVDISFNRLSSIISTIEIQKCLNENKLLPYIIIFFKVLLLDNNLNDASKGGLSSFRFFLVLKEFLQNNNLVFTEEQPILYIGEVIYKFTAFISMFKDKPNLVSFLQSRQGKLPLSPFFKLKLRERRSRVGVPDGSKECILEQYYISDKTVQETFLQINVPTCESVPTGKIHFTKILDTRNCFKTIYYRMIEWFITNVKTTNKKFYSEYKDLIFKGNCETIAFLNVIGDKYLDDNLKELYQIGRLFRDIQKEMDILNKTKEDKNISRNVSTEAEDFNNLRFSQKSLSQKNDICNNRYNDNVSINSDKTFNENKDIESAKNAKSDNEKKKKRTEKNNCTTECISITSKQNDNKVPKFFDGGGDTNDENNINNVSSNMSVKLHSISSIEQKINQLVFILKEHLNKNSNSSDTANDANDANEKIETDMMEKEVTVTDILQNETKREHLLKSKNYINDKGIKRVHDFSPTNEKQHKDVQKHDEGNSSGDKRTLKRIKTENSKKYKCNDYNTNEKPKTIPIKEEDFLSWFTSENIAYTSEDIDVEKKGDDFFTMKMRGFNILYKIHKTTDKVSSFFCNRLNILSRFFELKQIIEGRLNYYLQHRNEYENMKFNIYSNSEVEQIKQKIMSELSIMKQYDNDTISEFKLNSNFLL